MQTQNATNAPTVLVNVTQDDIKQGLPTYTENPLSLALARTLKTREIFVFREGGIALEMATPYRTIYLPPEATEWLHCYYSQSPIKPCALEARLSSSAISWHALASNDLVA